jgi:hypothetical protein
VVVVTASRHAAGQDAAAAPIATDQPAVTDSSVIVPAGILQAANGFAETVSQGQRNFDGPETLPRFGVASRTELHGPFRPVNGGGAERWAKTGQRQAQN